MCYKVIAESVLLLSIVDFDVFSESPVAWLCLFKPVDLRHQGSERANSMMFHVLIMYLKVPSPGGMVCMR